MIIEIVVILILIIANAIFSMSEIAVISSRKAILRQRADAGDNGARAALGLAESPNRFLSTIQVGITLIGVLAGAFGGATLAEEIAVYVAEIPEVADYSMALGVIIVVLAITYLTIIFGELVPKRIALSHPERISSTMASPMKAFSRAVYPAVYILSASTEVVARLLGIAPYEEPPVTEEEIRVLIDQGTKTGVIEEVEHDMVERVFRLGDLRAESLMTPRNEIVWLDIDESTEEIRKKIAESAHSFFPVGRGSIDNIIGIVQSKDLLPCSLKRPELDLKANLIPPLFVPESARALKALERFKRSGIHMAMVMDEYGAVQGLVTLTDILEAIVGDIPHIDELEEPLIIQRENGSWLVDGMLTIYDFKEAFKLESLPEEDSGLYQTMGGFAMMHLEMIPSTGDSFEWGGLRFEIVDMDDHRVDKLLVVPLGREDAGPAVEGG